MEPLLFEDDLDAVVDTCFCGGIFKAYFKSIKDLRDGMKLRDLLKVVFVPEDFYVTLLG